MKHISIASFWLSSQQKIGISVEWKVLIWSENIQYAANTLDLIGQVYKIECLKVCIVCLKAREILECLGVKQS